MRYNTSIGTEEGYEKRQQIRDTDINIHFSVWNQYAGADFFMQYTGSVAGKSDRDELVNDSVFLYGSFGRVYEYLQDSKETIQAGGKERKPC